MSTNIINITNTLTNIINMPAEVTNTVLRVAEMPSKAWWEIILMIGGPALTALSALFMWRSVEEMKRQKISDINLHLQSRLHEIETNFNKVLFEVSKLRVSSGASEKHSELVPLYFSMLTFLEQAFRLYFIYPEIKTHFDPLFRTMFDKKIRKFMKDEMPLLFEKLDPLETKYIEKYCEENNIDTEKTQ